MNQCRENQIHEENQSWDVQQENSFVKVGSPYAVEAMSEVLEMNDESIHHKCQSKVHCKQLLLNYYYIFFSKEIVNPLQFLK